MLNSNPYKLATSSSGKIFFTGHSKGGALAVLAAVDLNLNNTTVYTFEAPKVFKSSLAKQLSSQTNSFWRFEYENDMVPLVPFDEEFFGVYNPDIKDYMHVGNQAFIEEGTGIIRLFSNGERYQNDLTGFGKFIRKMSDGTRANLVGFFSWHSLWKSANFLADGCEQFIDNHFKVFPALERVAGGKAVPEPQLPKSIFATGIPDAKGRFMWGYTIWCKSLVPIKFLQFSDQ